MSIWTRIKNLFRANANTALGRAEMKDPGRAVDQHLRDYRASLAQATEAVAASIGNLRLAEAAHARTVREIDELGNKAAAASRRADQLRREGRSNEAKCWDDLARSALRRQVHLESAAKEQEESIASQRASCDQLREQLQRQNEQLADATAKRDAIVARHKIAQATIRVHEQLGAVSASDPAGEMARLEESVRQLEARAIGTRELAASSLESQFEELEALAAAGEADARLAALKSRGGIRSITSGRRPA